MSSPRRDPEHPANRRIDEQRDTAAAELLAALEPIGRALDLGCGRGHLLPTLGVAGMGTDLSAERLGTAPVPTAQADGTRLPFPPACFDLVVLSNVLSSVPDPTRRRLVADEAQRVLRSGGVILWYDQRWPNPRNPATRQVTAREVRQLFPGARVSLSPITLLPAVARLLPSRYDQLHGVPWLRTHLIGTIRPQASDR